MPSRHITRDTKSAAVDFLADAFVDDPLQQWIFSDEEMRASHIRQWMAAEVELGLRHGHAYIDLEGCGVALWGPPEGSFYDDAEFTTAMLDILQRAEPERRDTVLEGLMMIGEHFPQDTHFYLGVIGVAPQGRGAGVGERLIRRVLDTCDDEGLDAYLESSNPRNVSLYERVGFEVTAEITMPADGPTLRPMFRAARR